VRLIERRIGLLFAVFLGMLALAGLRAGWLGVVKADALRTAAATQQTAHVNVPARRGAITDRNGIELAVSQPATTVAATPYLIKDPVKVAAKLAKPLGTPEDKLLRQLTRRDTGFAYLARRVPAVRARRVERMKIEGLEFIPEARRTYPRDFLAAQLIGNVGSEGKGLSGLEYSLDGLLRGRDGERRLVKDALGEAIELRETRHTKPGAQVTLTVDEAIQDKAEQVLAEVGETWRPRGATAIVMDPRDGALLALANWPRVDANNPGDAPDYARQNRAVGATYEPGSTFKAFTVAGALEEREVTPETKFHLPPTIRLYDREIGESHPRGAVTLNTREILEQSSNVGAIRIGLGLGAKRFDQWVRRFGFGKPTGTDLPGEEAGIVLPLAKYSGASMGNLPIGQGLAVTPMQMAVGYAAIANGGILRPAHIVEKVDGRPSPPHKGRRILSAANSASLRKMLEGVLGPGGTASGAAIKGYELAGKTGTAQKPDPVTGGYSPDKYVASFVGFAPARHPKLLVTVMVDEPQGEIYGGLIAAPAFKEITSFALNYLRIPPE
jgi:cell division protein FtsI (penicillin-binding protein 3)